MDDLLHGYRFTVYTRVAQVVNDAFDGPDPTAVKSWRVRYDSQIISRDRGRTLGLGLAPNRLGL